MKIAEVDPLGLRTEPIGEISKSVEQILVTVLPVDGGLKCQQQVLRIVAHIEADLSWIILPKQGVLALRRVIKRCDCCYSRDRSRCRCWHRDTRIIILDCLLIVDDVEVEEGLHLIEVDLCLGLEEAIDLEIGACVETDHRVGLNAPPVLVLYVDHTTCDSERRLCR